jgi:hypothetical protein
MLGEKVSDNGSVFRTLSVILIFNGNDVLDTGLSPSSVKKPAFLGLIHRASPYLHTPEA